VFNRGDEVAVTVVEVDRERGRIGLRLADDPEIQGKGPEELAAIAAAETSRGGRDRSGGDRGRDRDRGPRGGGDRDRDRDRDRGPRNGGDRDRGRVRDRDPERPRS
jgi:polyribonucleotide nucleotidyltransferase